MDKKDYLILTDDDVSEMPMAFAVQKMEDAFREMAAGNLNAPPRFHVAGNNGELIFTAGSSTGEENVIGFRVYDTFPGSLSTPYQNQVVVVYRNGDGYFKGLVIGRLLGSMRTGGIGGVAIKHLSRPDSKVLGVIGTGYQAVTQVKAAFAVRDIELVRFYNRTRSKAEEFAAGVAEDHNVVVQVVDSAREAVAGADILLTVTDSGTPVIESVWLEPGMHVNNIGPKMAVRHEMPVDIVNVCDLVVCDSIHQVEEYGADFFLSPENFVALDQIIVGNVAGRPSAEAITLFVSVGLAGTEVVLANGLFNLVGGDV
jgi:ornithine cyclodeaminase